MTRKNLFWKKLSLLEVLLLCIMLFALAAILFPVYTGGGYTPGPATHCLSNVKQLALMQIMYSADYDDRFPLRDNWMDSTKEYRKGDDMLRCPSFSWDESSPKNQYGYAMNQVMSGAKATSPSADMPLLFDSINLARNASGTLDSLPDPARHNGKNTIGYADGHVKRMPNDDKVAQVR